ncbi:Hypothetical Protein RSKD131_2409 [Cereibacter sphaeroides KD131]|nr:Hypothetical Protein RSKD131_2409 [Cereibacter sphaeroides KD131]
MRSSPRGTDQTPGPLWHPAGRIWAGAAAISRALAGPPASRRG